MKFKFLSFISLLIGLLLNSFLLLAQTETLNDTVFLDELEISSSLLQSKAGLVGGSLASLDSKRIQSDNFLQLSELLPAIPGLSIQEGTINTNRITIRGIGSRTPYSSNRIKLYYDGIPLTNAQGETSISDLEVLNIRRIEVLRGPSSAIYGAGLGGVISITTEPSLSDSTHIMALRMMGSFGRNKIFIRPHVRTDKFYFSLAYGQEESVGYRENASFDRNTFKIVSGYQLRKSHLKWMIQKAELRGQIPSSINSEDFQNEPWRAAANWKAIKGFEDFHTLRSALTLTNFINPYASLKSIIFGSLGGNYESRPFNIQVLQSKTIGIREVFDYSMRKVKFRLGMEAFSEQTDWQIFETLSGTQGSLLLDDKAHLAYVNVNGLVDWDFSPDLKFEFGSNIQMSNRYHVPVLSPRLGFNYSGYKSIFIHGSMGHGFSLPSLEETILPDGSYNTSLKPERGWNIDMGVRTFGLNKRLTLDINVYQIFLSNLIVTKRLSDSDFLSVNAGKTSHTGVGFFSRISLIEQKTNRDGGLDFEVSSNLGRYTFTDFVDDEIDFSGNKLPGIPRFALNTSLRAFNWHGFLLNANYRMNGKQYLNDANDADYPGDFRMDISAGYEFEIERMKIRIMANAYNLTNEHYASMILVNAPSFGSALPRYYYPAPGRNYSIILRLIL